MRKVFDDLIADSDGDELLTTGEAAKLLGVSRQHIVNLIDRDELPAILVGTHRRVRRGDLHTVRKGATRATRDQDRSLWLSVAVAGMLVRDPERVREIGRESLATHQARPNRWTDEWKRLLDGPTKKIIIALTADTLVARELRQNSPFAGVLSAEERAHLLAQFDKDRSTN